MDTEQAANAMDALGSPVRLELYRLLIRAGETGMTITRIQQKTGMARSTLSHHLQRLIQGGLVSTEKDGAARICRANYPAVNTLVSYLSDECCVDEATGQTGEVA
ncbi:MAG: metalloregulator ArsR/SmtB family transcription factor [Rubrobacteraceae bacterium]